MSWGSEVEIERKRRINILIWAYAYEFENVSLVSDAKFDAECEKVDILIDTGDEFLDDFFTEDFDPSTGMWIRDFPELKRIKEMYYKHYTEEGRKEAAKARKQNLKKLEELAEQADPL
ncbi:hypothetical protein EKK58_07400 [Candidatus Dependentiae bacterium]|nr:MAG: hypothetical protein EKK58_07400 [Candidatus Dependentiae bacterium]